ncbi:hypothetical protein Q8G40_30045, partial [Klebsiella pneumoniae]|uniref:hypothetical protein n=1 Tax=Klebsiella pneumoniae TaxID=573 RepID=UPI003013E3C1
LDIQQLNVENFEDLQQVVELNPQLEDDTGLEVEPRRSEKARVKKSFGPDFLTYMLEAEP